LNLASMNKGREGLEYKVHAMREKKGNGKHFST